MTIKLSTLVESCLLKAGRTQADTSETLRQASIARGACLGIGGATRSKSPAPTSRTGDGSSGELAARKSSAISSKRLRWPRKRHKKRTGSAHHHRPSRILLVNNSPRCKTLSKFSVRSRRYILLSSLLPFLLVSKTHYCIFSDCDSLSQVSTLLSQSNTL